MSAARILIVEDEGIEALDIQQRLSNMGYAAPDIAFTGEEAVRKTKETRPDLVLMDIMLPGELDGVAAAKRIRDLFDIPVIYITAYADEATLQRAKITEPYGYILKPFKERELHITIETALYKHRIEKQLRESEKWLATTLSSIGDAVIATDKNGLITFMNPVAEGLTGWRLEECGNRKLTEIFKIINSETRQTVENPVVKVILKGYTVGLANHTRLIARNGAEIPIDDSAAPIKDAKGNMIGVILVFRDITEREKAEEELKHLNRVLRSIRDVNQLIAREKERDQLLNSICHKLSENLGYYNVWISLFDDSGTFESAFESGLGEHFRPFVERFKTGEFPDCIRKALKQTGLVIIEDPHTTCTGCPLAKTYKGRAALSARLEYAGTVYGVITGSLNPSYIRLKEETELSKELADDIAFALYCIKGEEERKKAEAALLREKNFSNTTIDSLPGVFYLFDEQGKFLRWNKNFEQVSGYSPAEMTRIHPLDLFRGEDKRTVEERIEEVFIKGKSSAEADFISKSGSRVPYYFTGNRVTFDQMTCLVGMGVDITERKNMEEALRRAQENLELRVVERTAQLSRVNQELTAEVGERKKAEEKLRDSERKLRHLSSELMTAQEKERKRIAGELHDSVASSLGAMKFSIEKALNQKQDEQRALAGLKDLISRVQQVMEDTRRIMADLRPSVLDDLGIVPAVRWFCREYEKTYSHIRVEKHIDLPEENVTDELKTAIFRISQEAMNNIAKHSRAGLVTLDLQVRDAKIQLTIRDNGQGFDPETFRRGLGLSTMRERAEFSGGSFDIESAVGKGTTVKAEWKT